MYRSYSVSNMPQPISTEPPTPRYTKSTESQPTAPKPKPTQPEKKEPASLSKLKSDDLILLIVIAVLIFNECNDKLLLLALIYIFFSDYFK